MFILEELEHAKKRGANIYAEILGYGTCFDPKSHNICSHKAEGATDENNEQTDSGDWTGFNR